MDGVQPYPLVFETSHVCMLLIWTCIITVFLTSHSKVASSAGATQKIRKFYKEVSVLDVDGNGWGVALDGRRIKTPSGKHLTVPTEMLVSCDPSLNPAYKGICGRLCGPPASCSDVPGCGLIPPASARLFRSVGCDASWCQQSRAEQCFRTHRLYQPQTQTNRCHPAFPH